jgi:hypothetical protein
MAARNRSGIGNGSGRPLLLDAKRLRGFQDLRGEQRLPVFVPYTTPELTGAALEAAAALTRSLRATAVLLAVHVVPILLPLEEPNVPREYLEQRLRAIAAESAIPVRVELVFTRDPETGLRQALAPESLVLIATRKRWWKTAEEKMARFLAREGHSVLLVTV